MRKSIYDILGEKINVVKEYQKLYQLFVFDNIYQYGDRFYSLAYLFNEFIEDWEYRSMYTDIEEILDSLELDEETTNEKAVQDILYLIELVLNINAFVESMINKDTRSVYNYRVQKIGPVKINYKNIMLENIDILLKKLGYKKVKDKKGRIKLRNDKPDAIETALVVSDKDIADLILDYNDFRIEKDLVAKKDILTNLGQYLEPLRKDIKKTNSNLEDYIFFCLNKLHLRHNNKDGEKRIEYIVTMSEKDLINWYDKIYDLILIAIRLLELPSIFDDFEILKNNILEEDIVKSI